MMKREDFLLPMRMLFVLALSIFLASTVVGQTEPPAGGLPMSAGGDAAYANVRLTVKVISQSYCADGGWRLNVTFKFTNVAGQKVLLHRFEPVVTRFMVSRSKRDAQKRKYEAHSHVLLVWDTPKSQVDESQFIELEVGSSYDIEKPYPLRFEGSLRPGAHVLQVVVPTWYDLRASNIAWREKLKDKGYLWSDSLLSAPVVFTVDQKAPRSNCN